jgi:RNA polymerase sigma factor (sigma-70 family)
MDALPEAEIKRIYLDALERAMRHAAAHVPREQAREIAHHVATAVARRPGDPLNDVDAFIHRAVLNRVREIWRAAKRRFAAESSYESERAAIAPGWSQPGSDIESRELQRIVESVIAAMPEMRRQVFLLVRRDQKTYKEVAAQLRVGVGTVHTHLSRANASLREAVAEYRGDARPSAAQPRTMGTGR